MAAHNIVNILKSHVEKQERIYLHTVDEDGNHPWLERDRIQIRHSQQVAAAVAVIAITT